MRKTSGRGINIWQTEVQFTAKDKELKLEESLSFQFSKITPINYYIFFFPMHYLVLFPLTHNAQ